MRSRRWCCHRTRLDDLDLDADRLELEVQGLRQTFHGELGAVVKGAEREGHFPADAGNVDDHTIPVCAEVREHRLGDLHQADHVGIELPPDLLGRGCLEHAVRRASILSNFAIPC